MNIIDALIVVFIVIGALGVAGLLLNDDSGREDEVKATIEVQVNGVHPYVADAISEGPVDESVVVAVVNKTVEPTRTVVKSENGTLREQSHPQKRTIQLQLTVNATSSQDELLLQGEPLEIGRSVHFDLGKTTVNGTITRLDVDGNRSSR